MFWLLNGNLINFSNYDVGWRFYVDTSEELNKNKMKKK